MKYSTRVKAGAFMMLAIALCVAARALVTEKDTLERTKDALSATPFEMRYEPLKPFLPEDEIVGYVTDVPREDTRGYYMTRYVLAPTRVAWEGDHEFAVGDFRDVRNIGGVLGARGYVVAKDLGHGVLLLKREKGVRHLLPVGPEGACAQKVPDPFFLVTALAMSFVSGWLLTEALWPRERAGLKDIAIKLSLAVGVGLGLSGGATFVACLIAGPSRAAILIADVVLLVILAAAVPIRSGWLRGPRGEKGVRHLLPVGPKGACAQKVPDPFFPAPATARTPWRPPLWLVLLVAGFLLLLVVDAWAFSTTVTLLPDGAWDAWTFWDLRAKYLVEWEPSRWKEAFESTPGLIGFHPDYPPLFPMMIARAWKWAGDESRLAHQAVAVAFTLATVGLLVSALQRLTGALNAFVAGIALLGMPLFIRHGGWQYADMPLAFFFLAALALMALYEKRGRFPQGKRGDASLTERPVEKADKRVIEGSVPSFPRKAGRPVIEGSVPSFQTKSLGLLALAGFCCGLAGLTKNEGIVFLAGASLAWVLATAFGGERGRRLRAIAAFAAGLAPALALLVYFKLRIAPLVSLLGPEGVAVSAKGITFAKAWEIVSASYAMILSADLWGPFPTVLLFYLLLAGGRGEKSSPAESKGTGTFSPGTGSFSPLGEKVPVPFRGEKVPVPSAFVCLAVVAWMLAGYFTAYLTTSHDVAWLLGTTLGRLFVQACPIAVFTLFLFTRSPDMPELPVGADLRVRPVPKRGHT